LPVKGGLAVLKERTERRLAAVLAADVVAYARLMGQDEARTHSRLKAIRRELVDPSVKRHGGRVVKSTGDGALVEFPSALEAVSCAVEVQKAMLNRNAGVPEDKRIVFRIGVNVGDLIIDEGYLRRRCERGGSLGRSVPARGSLHLADRSQLREGQIALCLR
jgi:class 3 adenylate cyclase